MLDSVRERLTLWYSAVLAVVLAVVCATTYFVVRRTLLQQTDNAVSALAESFVVTCQAELADEGNAGPNRLLSAARQAMIEHRSADNVFVVLDSTGAPLATSGEGPWPATTPNRRLMRALDADEVQRFEKLAGDGSERHLETIRAGGVWLRAYAFHFEASGQSLQLITLHSLHAESELLETIRLTFAWMILLALLLAGTGGYFLARKSLAPVRAMGERARRIGATNLHERLPVQNANDELGELATTFNDLLNRLDQSFERQRRFIADASHELRTPLAILRGEAEVALSQKGRKAEEYLESLRVLHEETSRLIKIVEDLFTLTRADSGQYQLSPEGVYLEEVVSDCAHSVRTLASEKKIQLNVDVASECLVHGDPALLRRMILNLLDNAIKYTGVGGQVEVTCSNSEAGCEVHFKDTGRGIPVELQSRVFERFFRADQARSRAGNEGAGLGLSIAQWIAQAHQGRLELIGSDAHGSHFAVYLPSHKMAPVAAH